MVLQDSKTCATVLFASAHTKKTGHFPVGAIHFSAICIVFSFCFSFGLDLIFHSYIFMVLLIILSSNRKKNLAFNETQDKTYIF